MLSTGLVDSYQNQDDVCYTYDQAVAAIAFLAKGDKTNARKVLDAAKSLQGSDGSWYGYFGNSLAVQETQKHVGPVIMDGFLYLVRNTHGRHHHLPAYGAKSNQLVLAVSAA
jgi:GH15 family glucan-1,4-alpha-glucosidase